MDLTARYDTNSQVTTNAQSDMVYIVGTMVGLKYEGTAVEMNGSYNLSAELFATHRQLDRASQNLSLNGDLSRMMASVLPNESTFQFREVVYYVPNLPYFGSNVQNPDTSATSTGPTVDVTTGGVITPRTNTFRNVFGITESTPLSPLTRIQFSYTNSFTRYQDPSLVGGQTNGVAISLSHDLSRTDALTGATSYSRVDPVGGPISHVYSVTVGEQHIFSPLLTGNASLGVGAAVLPAPTGTQFTENGSLGISKKINENLRLSAQASRGFGTNSGITGTPLVSDMGTVSLNEQFTQFLSGRVALNVARNHSLGKDPATGFRTDVHSQAANLGLSYNFTAWLTSNLEYGYHRQETFGILREKLIQNQYSFNLQAKWS